MSPHNYRIEPISPRIIKVPEKYENILNATVIEKYRKKERILKVLWTRIYPVVSVSSKHIEMEYAVERTLDKSNKIKSIQQLFFDSEVNQACDIILLTCYSLVAKHF